jgi:holo-[acyl-carrier protein] synthase
MKLATGVDLVEIKRIQSAIERHGERFLNRVFTAREIELAEGDIAFLAARFAAKEAVSKALGTGLGTVSPLHIEVLRNEANAPVLFLQSEAQQRANLLDLQTWSISLSHTNMHAIALVVAVGE